MADVSPAVPIVSLPKVDLHLHLETSLRLRRLFQRLEGDPLALEQAHLIADPSLFAGYDRLRRLRYASRASRIPDAAYTAGQHRDDHGGADHRSGGGVVRHVEVRVGGRRGFTLLGVSAGCSRPWRRAHRLRPPLGRRVRRHCHGRARTRPRRGRTLVITEAVACRDAHVVGVDLAGDEENYPPRFVRPRGRARPETPDWVSRCTRASLPGRPASGRRCISSARPGSATASAPAKIAVCSIGCATGMSHWNSVRRVTCAWGLMPNLTATSHQDGPGAWGRSDGQQRRPDFVGDDADPGTGRRGPGPPPESAEALVDASGSAARAAFLPQEGVDALERQIRSAPLPTG